MKKVSFLAILLHLAVATAIAAIISLIISIFMDHFLAIFMFAEIGALIWSFIDLVNGGQTLLFSRMVNKTIEKNASQYGFDNCATFYSSNAVVKINVQTGRIACIFYLNPTKFQVFSAKDIDNIKSDYIRAPLGGTNYVYFQFTCKGKRLRVPTFTATKCVYSLQSAEVLEAISKADTYAEILNAAKFSAVQAEV
ncbi:MAG: hypothetical protein IJZ47_11825 [Oscillospiraceae bacterium]|nr:hypothetical protein [Oscillospiraceae bacterium]